MRKRAKSHITAQRAYRAMVPLLLFSACVLADVVASADGPPGGGGQEDVACPEFDAKNTPFPDALRVSPTEAAGAISGSFSVSSTGEAGYVMPLSIPPGQAGMQPSLGIAYDSGAGDGVLGIGFSITGQSAVTRCPRNMARDGQIRAVRYDKDDALCLDGKRLVQIGDPGAAVAEYRTFPDTFARVLVYLPTGSDIPHGPQHIEVMTKSGLTIEYGDSIDSRVLRRNQVVSAWLMSQARDRNNNTIEYSYLNTPTEDGNTSEYALSRIIYNGHNTSADMSRTIEFEYDTKEASDVRTFLSDGLTYTSSLRLQHIKMLGDASALVRKYDFAYGVGAATGRTLLTQVMECAADTDCKPPTNFTWNHGSGPGFETIATQVLPPTADLAAVMPMDVTGDGLDDLVVADIDPNAHASTNWTIAPNLGTAAGFFSPIPPLSMPAFRNGDDDASLADHPEYGSPIDYNQDGRMDLLFHDVHWLFQNWQVLIAQPNRTFEILDTGIWHSHPGNPPNKIVEASTSAHLADVNGDGVPDLILCTANYLPQNFDWNLHLWSKDEGGFSLTPSPILELYDHPCNAEFYTIDLDADSKVDIVVQELLHTGNGPIAVGDYVAMSLAQPPTPGMLASWESVTTQLPVHIPGTGRLIFLDVNGDGLPDAVETGFQDNQPRTYINTGAGFSGAKISLAGPAFPMADKFANLATPIDYDGDGRQDLLIPIQAANNVVPSWVILKATGSIDDGTFTIANSGIPFDALLGTSANVTLAHPLAPRITDVDGDGAQDVLLVLNGTFNIFKNLAHEEDTLASITDGLNAFDPWDAAFRPNVKITYDHLVDHAITDGIQAGSPAQESYTYLSYDNSSNECKYPRRCVVGPRRVVSGYELNVGAYDTATGSNTVREYSVVYRDGRYDRLGFGFLGFGSRIVRDLATHSGNKYFYDNITKDDTYNIYPFAGQLVDEHRWSPSQMGDSGTEKVELSFLDISYDFKPTYQDKTYFVEPLVRWQRRKQGIFLSTSGQTLESWVKSAVVNADTLSDSTVTIAGYDIFGNALGHEVATVGVDLTVSVFRTISNDTKAWLLGKIDNQTECSTAADITQCRTTDRLYDNKGQIFQEAMGSLDGSPETQLTVNYKRDGFGNIVATTADDAPVYGHHRSSCTSYGADGVFPYAHGDAAGHLTYARFDSALGILTDAKDENGLVTQWAHDGFGRTTLELRPDGTITEQTLTRAKDGVFGDWNLKRETKTDHLEDDTVQYDSLGRPVRWWTQGVQTDAAIPQRILGEIVFDQLGEHVERRYAPAGELTPQASRSFDEYTYDTAGRVLRHTAPWGAITAYDYSGTTVHSTDTIGNTTETHNDALGRPEVVVDPNGGKTTYAYGPFGKLLKVTDPGEAGTTTNRDAYGRVRTLIDPDHGTTKSTYDGFGETVNASDDLGRTFTFDYDGLGRLIQRTVNDGTSTRWTWDNAANGIGKIASVTTSEGEDEFYTYNNLSRPSGQQTTIDGETFATAINYDVYGRVDTITYPEDSNGQSFSVRNKYDIHGHRIAARDSSPNSVFSYWTETAADDAGRITGEKFGNNAITTRTYYEDKNRLKSIYTTASNATVQNMFYEYDARLNLTNRADLLPQSTSEHFKYDALNRLTCASFVNTITCEPKDSYTYSPNGNITSKPGISEYKYDSTNHPHAVYGADLSTYHYDAVGNQDERPGVQQVTYTNFDMPKDFIHSPDEIISLDYDGNQRRVRKTTPTKETVYVGSLYERTTNKVTHQVDHRYYVYSNDGVAAVVTRSSAAGSNSTVYVHPDNLGSIDTITNELGAVLEKRSYDAFGARRSPNAGPPPVGGFSSLIRPGFTGHEGDDELGLVNMKGRIYDPQIGRFLTPDPVVSHPGLGQSWNPYSYVLNNPLGYVDPSGFDDSPAAATDPPWPGAYWDTESPVAGWCCIEVRAVKSGQAAADRDALKYAATTTPVDVSIAGNTAGYEAPPSPLEEKSSGQKAGDFGIGFLTGIGKVALGVGEFAVLNAVTLGGYSTYQFWSSAWSGYKENGFVGAINSVNPFYQVARTGADVYMSAENDNYEKAGEAAAVGTVLAAAMAFEVVAPSAGDAQGAGPPPRGLHDEAGAARDALATDLVQAGGHPPAVVVGAYSPSTGQVTAGASAGGGLGCAEGACAKALGHPPDIQFTTAVRPRNGVMIPVCENCESTYGRGAFPDPGTLFKSDIKKGP